MSVRFRLLGSKTAIQDRNRPARRRHLLGILRPRRNGSVNYLILSRGIENSLIPIISILALEGMAGSVKGGLQIANTANIRNSGISQLGAAVRGVETNA